MSDTKKYDNSETQKHLLEALISSPEVFSLCEPLFNPKFFDPKLMKAASFIQRYYDEHSTIPQTFQIKSESGIDLRTQPMSNDVEEWAKKEFESFARHRAMIMAMSESIDDIQKGEYDSVLQKILRANDLALPKELGINYFLDVDERIEKMKNEPPVVSTGWKSVDEKLNGGIGKGELILFLGASGVGKSITLANFGLNYAMKKRTVLFISLELSDVKIAQRYDQMFLGIGNTEWQYKTKEVEQGLKKLNDELGTQIQIAKLPAGSRPRDIKAYLKNFHLKFGYYPDLCIVDYLDEMLPNQNVSIDNIAERDKQSASQLRQIGDDFGMTIATASQLNREAVEAPVLNHSHIAGGMGKIRISDATIAIRMDEQQKQRGVMEFYFMKTRNSDGVYSSIHMGWDRRYLRIVDPKDSDSGKTEELKFVSKKDKEKNEIGESKDSSVNDMFDLAQRKTRKLPKL